MRVERARRLERLSRQRAELVAQQIRRLKMSAQDLRSRIEKLRTGQADHIQPGRMRGGDFHRASEMRLVSEAAARNLERNLLEVEKSLVAKQEELRELVTEEQSMKRLAERGLDRDKRDTRLRDRRENESPG